MNTDYDWLRWWSYAWRHADTDWFPLSLRFLERDRLDRLARSHHAAIGNAFGIKPSTPPRPRPAVQALVCGDRKTRELCTVLVASACHPRGNAHGLSPQDHAWCERLAKALRPGQWLAEQDDILVLLRAWLGEPAWQRARLQFSRSRIDAMKDQPVPTVPSGRLDTLWQSAYWKAQQTLLAATPYREATPDASPSYA